MDLAPCHADSTAHDIEPQHDSKGLVWLSQNGRNSLVRAGDGVLGLALELMGRMETTEMEMEGGWTHRRS